MSAAKKPQFLKPATLARKLEIYLPAAPAEIQEREISREDFAALLADPPQWLQDLRANGPHPRSVIAARLRVSNSSLVRAGITGALTTGEIEAVAADKPEWLLAAQESRRAVKAIELAASAARATPPAPRRRPVA